MSATKKMEGERWRRESRKEEYKQRKGKAQKGVMEKKKQRDGRYITKKDGEEVNKKGEKR